MTDRELLELAAKAAGIAITFGHFGYGPYYDPLPDIADQQAWNPLADDGEALRLAAELELPIEFENGATWVRGVKDGGWHLFYESHGEDKMKATRRVIVTAAAEIGKSKE